MTINIIFVCSPKKQVFLMVEVLEMFDNNQKSKNNNNMRKIYYAQTCFDKVSRGTI
jgi:hypothetical protein